MSFVEWATKNGYSWGHIPLKQPISIESYKDYLKNGYHASMKFLEDHLPIKENPQSQYSNFNSAYLLSKNYIPHPKPMALPQLKIARYAQGQDYHYWIKQELRSAIELLQLENPEQEFLCFTDSAPILERDYALQAGLGWVGKNSCIIHPQRGSFFLLAEILSTQKVETKIEPIPDRCGTCTRCIDACPTGAIVENKRTINSNLCISYWTIEAKTDAPENLREKFSSWYFGCDICQEVCPWNQKAFGKEFFQTRNVNSMQELCKILLASNREIERIFQGSPLLRASPKHHKRNAILCLVSEGYKEALPTIVEASKKYPDLQDLCEWALQKLR